MYTKAKAIAHGSKIECCKIFQDKDRNLSSSSMFTTQKEEMEACIFLSSKRQHFVDIFFLKIHSYVLQIITKS